MNIRLQIFNTCVALKIFMNISCRESRRKSHLYFILCVMLRLPIISTYTSMKTILIFLALFTLSCQPFPLENEASDVAKRNSDAHTQDIISKIDSSPDLRKDSESENKPDLHDLSKDINTTYDMNTQDMSLAFCPDPLPPIQVWLIGDSTVATNSGWGDFFGNYLDNKASAFNKALGGRSSKSFYEETNSNWNVQNESVMKKIKPGDYVLIQFAHNDEKKEAYRHTEPGESPNFNGSFRQYNEQYFSETRAKGATPILLSPVSRMVFGSDGKLKRTHGNYPDAARKIAADNQVILLDLEQKSFEIFDALGNTKTVELYGLYDGKASDRTHFPKEKGHRVTEMVIELLSKSESPLGCYIKP